MKIETKIFHPGQVKNPRGQTVNTKAGPTTTGEPNKKPTAIHKKSGATLTNLCEFRPATTGKGQKPPEKRPASAKENVYCGAFLNCLLQPPSAFKLIYKGMEKPANTVYGRRLLRGWTTQRMDQQHAMCSQKDWNNTGNRVHLAWVDFEIKVKQIVHSIVHFDQWNKLISKM